jgi:Na+/proline symporter
METIIGLLLIIVSIVYLGVGYISTLVFDISEKKGNHMPTGQKLISTFLWPIMMIGYFVVRIK